MIQPWDPNLACGRTVDAERCAHKTDDPGFTGERIAVAMDEL
jgi:hypothetical protein